MSLAARAGVGLAVVGGVVYAVGGFDGKEFLSCVECLYSPDGEWTSLCVPPANIRSIANHSVSGPHL